MNADDKQTDFSGFKQFLRWFVGGFVFWVLVHSVDWGMPVLLLVAAWMLSSLFIGICAYLVIRALSAVCNDFRDD